MCLVVKCQGYYFETLKSSLKLYEVIASLYLFELLEGEKFPIKRQTNTVRTDEISSLHKGTVFNSISLKMHVQDGYLNNLLKEKEILY